MQKVSTFFTDSDWKLFGIDWLNSAKKSKLSGFVFANLNEDNKSEAESLCSASDLSFFEASSYFDICAKLSTILKNEKCLFLPPSVNPSLLLSSSDVICRLVEAKPVDFVNSIYKLDDKVTAVRSLERIKNVYGSLLSSELLCGTADFWHSFFGFQNLLCDKGFFENYNDQYYPDLALNLFFANSTSFSLETIT